MGLVVSIRPWPRAALPTLALVATALAFVLLLLANAPSHPAHASSQVALTASYSIVGGGGPGVADLLTYVSNGAQQVVPLSGSPTVYMLDSGTQWSVQSVLTGSGLNERWTTATGSLSGTIAAPLTVSFTYYHQYFVEFNFSVTYGGMGYTAPTVSYDTMGVSTSSLIPYQVWVDASSPYSYGGLLPGSSSTERWVASTTLSGTIGSSETVSVDYYHQFDVSSSFSIAGGGSPAPPVLASTSLGSATSVTMSASTQQSWFDAGANYSFTPSLTESGVSAAKETWLGTVTTQTQSGNALSFVSNGTVAKALSITPVYYHRFLVNVTFNYVGGGPTGLTPPSFSYLSLGSKGVVNGTSAAVWVDAGSNYTRSGAVCCPSSPTYERWVLYNTTTGAIVSPTLISSTFFHQYYEAFAYSVAGAQPPNPSGQPTITYIAGGNDQQLSLLVAPQSAWADSGSSYTAESTLPASVAQERWFAPFSSGVIKGPPPDNNVVVTYSQQYLIGVTGNGPASQWANAGANETVYFPSFFGRSEGTGYRVVSYQLDSGNTVTITTPTLLLPITMSLGTHTVAFQYVVQFQVILDAGAAGALQSISPSTLPGDDHWFDSGSAVQLVLSGAWGRHDGVGHRLTSIADSAEPTLQVDTVGSINAYSTPSMDSPVTITTTSVTQYEVVLNKAALAAFASVSPPSTFQGDTFWYDSGSPAVTVTLNGAYSRSAGSGLRTTSWELDSGAVTKEATVGPISITTGPMTSPQFVNATSVVQYEVTIDAGGAAAVSDASAPSIPLDQGWYDSASPVGLVLNGAWGRAAGVGHRLSAYSVNGGASVSVSSTGLVTVLDLAGISSPQNVTATVVTQYQVVLDAGASAALSSITQTPIPQDKDWFDSGTQVSVALDSVWDRSSTGGLRLSSYSVNQGPSTTVLSSSPVQVLVVSAISGPESISTKAVQQYHLVSAVAPSSLTSSTLPGDSPGWFDSGTVVKAVYDKVWNTTSSGSRESVEAYSIDGGGKTGVARGSTGNFTVSVAMAAGHTITLVSVTQYSVTVKGAPAFTAAPPSPTGDSYFDSGTKVAFSVPTSWNDTSGAGVREVLSSYSMNGGPSIDASPNGSETLETKPIAMTQPLVLSFSTRTQYEVAFQFFDGVGRNSVQANDVQIGVGNATVDLQGQSTWLSNGTSFRLLAVIWESANVVPTPAPTYKVKGAPLFLTLDTRVYPVSVRAVDPFGLPVSGARVEMTLANGTLINGTTTSDGKFGAAMVPLGAFTAKLTSLGIAGTATGSSGQAVVQARVPLSFVSLLVFVAAVAGAGGGAFLFVRRRRARPAQPSKAS